MVKSEQCQNTPEMATKIVILPEKNQQNNKIKEKMASQVFQKLL